MKNKKNAILTKHKDNKSKANSSELVHPEFLVKLRLIIMGLIFLVVFFPPFLRGLFFDEEKLFTEIVVFLIFALFIIYKFLKRKDEFVTTPIDHVTLLLIIFLILSLFISIAFRDSLSEVLVYCMAFCILFMISELFASFSARVAIMWTIILSSVVVCLLGIDSILGGRFVNILNSLLNFLQVNDLFGLKNILYELHSGNRLSSVFQYPNTFAAYIIASYVVLIGLWLICEKCWIKFILSSLSAFMVISFVLTQSRGAYAIFPLVIIVLILLLPRGQRIKSTLFLLGSVPAPVIVSLLFIQRLPYYSTNYMPSLAILALCALICGLLVTIFNFINRIYLNNIAVKTHVITSCVLVVILVVGILYVLRSIIPLQLGQIENTADNEIKVVRRLVLEPNKDYKLSFDIKASLLKDKPYACTVYVSNSTEKSILFGNDTLLAKREYKSTYGIEQKVIEFNVPGESKIVNIIFTNKYSETQATIFNAKVIDNATSKIIKNIPLKYKYLPETIISRIEDAKLSKNALSRSAFYKDAFKIIKNRFIAGYGGGAWPYVYQTEQSYLYFTTQAHNFLLQLAVEYGIIGILLFVFASVLVISIFIKLRKTLENSKDVIITTVCITCTFAIFTHSLLDFDISYASILLLVFELLAILNSYLKERSDNDVKNFYIFSKLHIWLFNKVKLIKIQSIVMIIPILLLTILSILLFAAQFYNRSAKKEITTGNFASAANCSNKAITLDPYSTQYKMIYANSIVKKSDLTQSELDKANEQVLKAESLSSYDAILLADIGSYYLKTGNIEKGLTALDKSINIRPLEPNQWHAVINAYYKVVDFYLKNNDFNNCKLFIERGLSYVEKAKIVNAEKNLNPFIFIRETQEVIERMYFLKEYLDKLEAIDINKIIFFNTPQIDINNDGIPDQWNYDNPTNANIFYKKGLMHIENLKENYVKIMSRKLTLEPNSRYSITVELENPFIESIDFAIKGVSSETRTLTRVNKFYSVYITTQENFVNSENILVLGFPSKTEVKSILIMKQ